MKPTRRVKDKEEKARKEMKKDPVSRPNEKGYKSSGNGKFHNI